MRKILILDHIFNIQSMSGYSSKHPELTFHHLNSNLSINDNLDTINPDYILINKFFVDNFMIEDIKKLKNNLSIIDIPYIIPNEFGQIELSETDNCIACIVSDNTFIKKEKVYKKNDIYHRIFNVFNPIKHIQHYGSIMSCKDLSIVISSHVEIVIDQPIFASLCSFYGKHYSYINNVMPESCSVFKTNKEIINDILK